MQEIEKCYIKLDTPKAGKAREPRTSIFDEARRDKAASEQAWKELEAQKRAFFTNADGKK